MNVCTGCAVTCYVTAHRFCALFEEVFLDDSEQIYGLVLTRLIIQWSQFRITYLPNTAYKSNCCPQDEVPCSSAACALSISRNQELLRTLSVSCIIPQKPALSLGRTTRTHRQQVLLHISEVLRS